MKRKTVSDYIALNDGEIEIIIDGTNPIRTTDPLCEQYYKGKLEDIPADLRSKFVLYSSCSVVNQMPVLSIPRMSDFSAFNPCLTMVKLSEEDFSIIVKLLKFYRKDFFSKTVDECLDEYHHPADFDALLYGLESLLLSKRSFDTRSPDDIKLMLRSLEVLGCHVQDVYMNIDEDKEPERFAAVDNYLTFISGLHDVLKTAFSGEALIFVLEDMEDQ